MNKKMSKRQRDLKTKLMAAICMLLVSSIMMVSTTYAWFTLSTAPEVTGITTAVGANGNLEMALLPTSGETNLIGSSTGDSSLPDKERNVTWGNLVDLSDNTSYGLDKISLYPSALNVGADGKVVTASPVKFPTYGADGRVSELVANSSTGIYDTGKGSFSPDANFGVRAVGSASGMTDRQLSYRNARAIAESSSSYAAQLASISLNTHGNALANIAIKKGTNVTEFTKDDVTALQAIITDLNTEDGILDQIETAYMQYLLALGASAKAGTEDTAWLAVKALVEADDATLTSVMEGLAAKNVEIPDELNAGIAKYQGILTAVASAQSTLTTLGTKDTYTWTEISPVLTALANPDNMKVNGFKASEIKDNMNGLVNSALGGNGVQVTLGQGAGVYADIADQTDDFKADVNIQEVNYAGQTFGPLPAKMLTEGKSPSYLDLVGSAVTLAGAPGGGAAGSVPITDMYGYIIDMAFRTNAANSNLLLQVLPADRIYTENTTGVESSGNGQGDVETTMGNGANMTFTSTNATFTNAMMQKLMQAIRLVFFDPNSGTIYKYGKLDTTTSPTADGGLKANIILCDKTNATTSTVYFTKTETGTRTYTVYYTDATLTTPFCRSYTEEVTTGEGEETVTTTKTMWEVYTLGTGEAEGTYGTATETQPADIPSQTVQTEAGLAPCATQAIMALNQNTAQKLSVMVYLDGENITNADVAANGSSSCNAELNLQFASDANLTPMNYTPLMNQGGTGGNTNGGEATTYTVTIDGTASTAAIANTAYTFTLGEGESVASIKVGGTDLTAADYTVSEQSVTIKAEKVTGAIVITTA